MKSKTLIEGVKNNRLFFAFIIITLITSWFSIGFYNVDEHFQILEFGGYKARWVPRQDLPWEFSSAIRSSVQPFIVFLLIKVESIFNLSNPFTIAFLLRLITAALCITCYAMWRSQLKRAIDSPSQLKWYDAALLLWFLPYLSVRCTSEIWSGSLFFISLAMTYGKNEISPRKFLMAGMLGALAFFLRFQTGFLIAGMLFIRLFISKRNFNTFIWYGAGFLVMTIANVGLDYLFYHKWCFTPWNYFFENILKGRAAAFGTAPFYFYFPQLLENALPLQGLAIMAVFAIYISRKVKDEISIAALFFIMAHFITAHKDIRFLIPLIFILPYVFAHSMQWFSEVKFSKNFFFRVLIWLTVIPNMILLLLVTLKPADTQVLLQRVLYRMIGNNPTTVFYENENPYIRANLNMDFYKNKNMNLKPLYSLDYNPVDNSEQRILIVSSVTASTPLKDNRKFQLIYQNIPQWLTKFNFNDWLSRTSVFRVYEMKAH